MSLPADLAGLADLAAEVLDLLRQRGQTLAVAESLTGGLLAAELTGVPGASHAFRGSVTAYATDLKGSLLGVDAGLLEERGAVDPAVAEQMALGVRRALGAHYGMATTGVAGPEPQDGKPVGTVYVAVAGPRGTAVAAPRLAGDRAAIRRGAMDTALRLLREALLGGTAQGPGGVAEGPGRVAEGGQRWNSSGTADVCSPE